MLALFDERVERRHRIHDAASREPMVGRAVPVAPHSLKHLRREAKVFRGFGSAEE
jgi:hypothetical protein